MNKEELKKIVDSLNLPKDEYYILSSGSLALYDLRENAKDLDLCVSKELFERLKEKFNIDEKDKNNCGFYKVNDFVECIPEDKKSFTSYLTYLSPYIIVIALGFIGSTRKKVFNII